MSKQSNQKRAEDAGGVKSPSVDALATTALSMVAQRNAKAVQNMNIDLAIRLRDAAAESSSNAVPDLLAEMLASGITSDIIATVYIPHAARQLGDDWCEDTLSFARVTIGTARLQSSLRSLGADWSSHGYSDDTKDEGVVVIVAKDAFHTLGAMVLCGQLRREGLSVRLAMGASVRELRAIFAASKFDAALISASLSESLDTLRDYVDIIRQSCKAPTPIVIGGNVLDQEADVKAITGADFATNDPFEALKHCGITKITHARSRQKKQPV